MLKNSLIMLFHNSQFLLPLMLAEPLIMLSNYADYAIIIARSLSGVVPYLVGKQRNPWFAEQDVLVGSAPDSWELARGGRTYINYHVTSRR